MKRGIDRRMFLTQSAAGLIAAGIARAAMPSPAFAEGLSEEELKEYFIFPEGARHIEEAPPKIVESEKIRLGVFRLPVKDLNFGDSLLAQGWFNNFPEFIAFGLPHPEWYFAVIVIDPKTFPFLACVYAIDRRTGQLYVYQNFSMDWESRLAVNTWNDDTFVKGRTYSVNFAHRLEKGYHEVKFSLPKTLSRPAFNADLKLTIDLEKFQPMTTSMLLEPRHWCYTQKAFLPISGEIAVGKEKVVFDPKRDLANLDESRNLSPTSYGWLWGTFARLNENGGIDGINVATRNIISDPDRFSENCYWLDNKKTLLGDALWEVDDSSDVKLWRMKDKRGKYEFDFRPEGLLSVGSSLIGNKYYQAAGKFTGKIIDDSGNAHAFDSVCGVIEKGRLGWSGEVAP